MTPILFPYTFADTEMIDRFSRYFQSLTILQPSSRFVPEALHREAGRGRIGLKVPVDTANERLSRQLRDQRAWAEFTGEKSLRGAGLRPDGIPFFEEGSVHGIRQQIRQAAGGEAASSLEEDGDERLFAARLFLLFAQHHDEQNAELEEKIERAAELERAMLQSLTGSEAPPTRPAGGQCLRTYLSFLIESRLDHWCRLACQWPVEAPFWVTPNRAVFDALTGEWFSPVLVKQLEATAREKAPVLAEGTQLHQSLEKLSQTNGPFQPDGWDVPRIPSPESALAPDSTLLSVYLLPGVSQQALLRRGCPPEDVCRDNLCPSTILGVLE